MGDSAAPSAISSAASKGSKAASTGARTGLGAMLHDPKRMQGMAEGLGAIGQEMAPDRPPPSMAPMDMNGGAAMANGDPSALVALARQRPDIFARMGRFNRGGF